MYARNTTISELTACANAVGLGISADDEGNRIRFTLKLGADRKFEKYNPHPMEIHWFGFEPTVAGWKWRRSGHVCFHGHYEFLAELFRRNPRAVVDASRLGKVRYTADNFYYEAANLGNTPAGTGNNIYSAFKQRDFCWCEHDLING